MDQQDRYDRILGSLHEAAFDAARWPETSGLIDAACGVKGDALIFAGGRSQQDVEIYFAQFCFRGQRREDFERLYLGDYWSRDERVPRLRRLPDSRLVHVKDLYTEAERKTSATYNEAMRSTETQDSLNVRLDGPDGTRVVWALGDPVDAGGWGSDRTEMVERLLPHVRQFVRVHHALVEAGALGQSLAGLLDVTGVGVIHLDRRGQMVAANDRAVELLRQGDGLIYKDDVLHAVEPTDDAELQRLLERAVPRFGGQGAAGSMMVSRSLLSPRLVLHVSPAGGRSTDFGIQRVAACVLIVDPAHKPHINADLVASALGLTPTESAIAVMLATGYSLPAIAASMRRAKSTIRWHLKRIFAKQRISRQADLVRLVLSVSSATMSRR
ncbi:MAG: helix-turn-helix transcriptional regulator [Acidobacteria bacterium]|nr:helix-turn-helix transcriptional regulator [Acidobacteriota bacterium]